MNIFDEIMKALAGGRRASTEEIDRWFKNQSWHYRTLGAVVAYWLESNSLMAVKTFMYSVKDSLPQVLEDGEFELLTQEDMADEAE